ncbi:heme utilization cystosolic carrier protein HutX [Deefgea tanakiae]|uniref:heme utilization cystosolic carrier protein HutX n=1 Tax=Deefgea tanakiae TaxID=2865840 RepID=UPI0027E5289D|nr:heme utilization cystosolic carrier protein HutX [Deefgea tanakiae]
MSATQPAPTLSNAEQKAAISQRLAANPGVILEQLADSHQCAVAEVIECLPAALWQKMAGERFIELMNAVHQWQTPVTLITHSNDAILEFTGPLPVGEVGHGFFNLQGSTGLHGHLRYQNCAAIYWVERPFMGKPTASLIFCNQAGAVMFKIFVGRDEQGQLRTEQIKALRALANKETA